MVTGFDKGKDRQEQRVEDKKEGGRLEDRSDVQRVQNTGSDENAGDGQYDKYPGRE